MISCSSQEMLPEQQNELFVASTKTRSLQQALDIANHTFSLFDANSRSSRHASLCDVNAVLNIESRSSDLDTLIYAVNAGDGNGFVLVSSPINVEPVLAIIESGKFGDEITESNESFKYVLSQTKQYVSMMQDSLSFGEFSDSIKQIQFEQLLDKNVIFKVPKRVQTEWGLKWPENMYAPNKNAGCVPVAISQVCSYFKEPTFIDPNYTIGHVWVADGVISISDHSSKYQPVVISNYIHYNWGMHGNANGYFYEGIFDMADAYRYDNSNNTSSYNYENIQYLHIK